MITLNNQYAVVLDACVLAPMPLCDTLLRLAEEPAFFAPKWSQPILDEVGNYLRRKKHPYSEDQITYRLAKMNEAFEEAMVDGFESLIPCMDGMDRDPNDRHVLAAAVRCGADAIITSNVRDFPKAALDRYGVELMTPDEFLVNQYHFDPETVLDKLKEQSVAVGCELRALLATLGLVAPQFAELANTPL